MIYPCNFLTFLYPLYSQKLISFPLWIAVLRMLHFVFILSVMRLTCSALHLMHFLDCWFAFVATFAQHVWIDVFAQQDPFRTQIFRTHWISIIQDCLCCIQHETWWSLTMIIIIHSIVCSFLVFFFKHCAKDLFRIKNNPTSILQLCFLLGNSFAVRMPEAYDTEVPKYYNTVRFFFEISINGTPEFKMMEV